MYFDHTSFYNLPPVFENFVVNLLILFLIQYKNILKMKEHVEMLNQKYKSSQLVQLVSLKWIAVRTSRDSRHSILTDRVNNGMYSYFVTSIVYNDVITFEYQCLSMSSSNSGIVDSCGMTFTYLETLREFDAGVLYVGNTGTPLMVISPNAANYTISVICSVDCTEQVFFNLSISFTHCMLHAFVWAVELFPLSSVSMGLNV